MQRTNGRLLLCAVVAAALVWTACGANGPLTPTPAPAWLTALIRDLETQPVANPPASITRYTYQGRAVYYLSARCCDIPSVLFDAQGKVLCQPDGGLSGRGDGRCPDFLDERKDPRLIWRDPRG